MTPTPLKGALIGAGDVTEFHLYAWQQIPQAEIVAIADPNLEIAQSRAQQFNISRTTAGLAELLQTEPDLDFIDIAAPPEAHLELVKVAAEHDLHINCQKPFAPSLAEAREMIRVCREANVLLNINENWRWRPWHRRLRHLLAGGKIGQPVYARIFSHSPFMVPDTRYNQRRLKSDHRFRYWQRVLFYDWGTHYVDILRFLFGEPVTVYARMDRLNPNIGGDDRALVVLSFERLTAVLDFSWSSFAPWGYPNRTGPIVEDLRIEGDAGTLALNPHNDSVCLTTATEEWEQPAYDDPDAFDAYRRSYIDAQGHFIDCLLHNRLPETHAADNYKTLAITLATYESAEKNQVVNIADFEQQTHSHKDEI